MPAADDNTAAEVLAHQGHDGGRVATFWRHVRELYRGAYPARAPSRHDQASSWTPSGCSVPVEAPDHRGPFTGTHLATVVNRRHAQNAGGAPVFTTLGSPSAGVERAVVGIVGAEVVRASSTSSRSVAPASSTGESAAGRTPGCGRQPVAPLATVPGTINERKVRFSTGGARMSCRVVAVRHQHRHVRRAPTSVQLRKMAVGSHDAFPHFGRVPSSVAEAAMTDYGRVSGGFSRSAERDSSSSISSRRPENKSARRRRRRTAVVPLPTSKRRRQIDGHHKFKETSSLHTAAEHESASIISVRNNADDRPARRRLCRSSVHNARLSIAFTTLTPQPDTGTVALLAEH